MNQTQWDFHLHLWCFINIDLVHLLRNRSVEKNDGIQTIPRLLTTVCFFFKVSSVDEMPNHPWNYDIFKGTISGPRRMKQWNPSKFTLERITMYVFFVHQKILKDILNLHRGSPENSNLWPSTCVSAVQVLLWQADAQTLPQDGWFVRGYEGIHCWLNAKAASLLQIWRSHITRL